MSQDVLKRLADPTVVAVAVRGPDWPRPLLSDVPIPDAWMGLVESPDGRRRFVPAGQDPRPEREDRLTLVRNRAVSVPLVVKAVAASCGSEVDAECELLIRWDAREVDLAALREALLPSGSLSLSRLASAVVDGGGRVALTKFVSGRTAESLLRDDLRDELRDALSDALQRFCFECGCRVERVARLICRSESYQRRQAAAREAAQRVEQIRAREAVEAAAREAALRRLDEMSALLEKLKAASPGDSSMRWHELLPALTPAERGRLLENLWRITPNRVVARGLVVAAGDECAWLDPADPDRIVRRRVLPGELGGVRSVQYCPRRDWLLVGAAAGVWAVHASDGEVVGQFAVPGAGQPRTGFNAAAIVGDRVFATHSQLGCWSWPLHGGGEATQVFGRRADEPAGATSVPGALPSLPTVGRHSVEHSMSSPATPRGGGAPRSVRAVTALADGRAAFAADDRVYVSDGGVPVEIGRYGDVVHALAADGDDVYIGTESGRVLRVSLGQPEDTWVPFRRSGPVESIVVRRWNDLVELVVPAGPLGICAVYEQEGVVSPLMESALPIRRAWACDDLVVGLSERRDRLVVLAAGHPARGGVDVPIARLLASSVQDVCIVTGAAEGVA